MQMWATFAIIAAAIVLFASEAVALELVGLGVVVAFILLFQFCTGPERPGGEPAAGRCVAAGVLQSGADHDPGVAGDRPGPASKRCTGWS